MMIRPMDESELSECVRLIRESFMTVAERFGIRADRAATYRKDRRGIELNYSSLSDTVMAMRRGDIVDGSWKADIEDYEKNGDDKEPMN